MTLTSDILAPPAYAAPGAAPASARDRMGGATTEEARGAGLTVCVRCGADRCRCYRRTA
jgi:hypothetical protein